MTVYPRALGRPGLGNRNLSLPPPRQDHTAEPPSSSTFYIPNTGLGALQMYHV